MIRSVPCKTHTFAHVKSDECFSSLYNGMPSANLRISDTSCDGDIVWHVDAMGWYVQVSIRPRDHETPTMESDRRSSFVFLLFLPPFFYRLCDDSTSPSRLCNKSAHLHTRVLRHRTGWLVDFIRTFYGLMRIDHLLWG